MKNQFFKFALAVYIVAEAQMAAAITCANQLTQNQTGRVQRLMDLGYNADVAQRIVSYSAVDLFSQLSVGPQIPLPQVMYRGVKEGFETYDPSFGSADDRRVYFASEPYTAISYMGSGGLLLKFQLPMYGRPPIVNLPRRGLGNSSPYFNSIPDDRIFLLEIGRKNSANQLEWIKYGDAVDRGLIRDML